MASILYHLEHLEITTSNYTIDNNFDSNTDTYDSNKEIVDYTLHPLYYQAKIHTDTTVSPRQFLFADEVSNERFAISCLITVISSVIISYFLQQSDLICH